MSNTITQSSLKTERGWTNSLIENFLGKPDLRAPNYYHKNAAPLKLYFLSRVEAVEKSDAFQKALEKNVLVKLGRERRKEIRMRENTLDGGKDESK